MTNCVVSVEIGFELNINMRMYYVFGNRIYSISSMTTYVLLVWQTYLIYTNNL